MALRIQGRGPIVARAIEAGVEVMGTLKTAPETGVIRNEAGGARRVRKGAPIPEGWTFDDGTEQSEAPAKKRTKKPAENTEAAGPSETDAVEAAGTVMDRRTERRQS